MERFKGFLAAAAGLIGVSTAPMAKAEEPPAAPVAEATYSFEDTQADIGPGSLMQRAPFENASVEPLAVSRPPSSPTLRDRAERLVERFESDDALSVPLPYTRGQVRAGAIEMPVRGETAPGIKFTSETGPRDQ